MTELAPPSFFSRFKTAYAAWRLPLWQVVAIGVLAPAIVSGYRAWHHDSADRTLAVSFEAGILPACDSVASRHLLSSTLDDAPALKSEGAKLVKLGDVHETGFVPVNAKGSTMRLCTADVFLNVGRKDVNFTLEWTSAAKDELWIEVDTSF